MITKKIKNVESESSITVPEDMGMYVVFDHTWNFHDRIFLIRFLDMMAENINSTYSKAKGYSQLVISKDDAEDLLKLRSALKYISNNIDCIINFESGTRNFKVIANRFDNNICVVLKVSCGYFSNILREEWEWEGVPTKKDNKLSE